MSEQEQKKELEKKYLNLMMDGCMCNIPPQETMDKLYASYEELGGTKDELIKKAVELHTEENMIRVSKGGLGWPCM